MAVEQRNSNLVIIETENIDCIKNRDNYSWSLLTGDTETSLFSLSFWARILDLRFFILEFRRAISASCLLITKLLTFNFLNIFSKLFVRSFFTELDVILESRFHQQLDGMVLRQTFRSGDRSSSLSHSGEIAIFYYTN